MPFPKGAPLLSSLLSLAVFETTALRDIGSRPWPFRITWRHLWRHLSICHRPFPVSGYLFPTHHLKLFLRYLHLYIIRSRSWPIWVYVTSSVTWPIDSTCAISYRCPFVTETLSRAIFEITGLKDIGVTLTFQGHVMSSTSSFDPP